MLRFCGFGIELFVDRVLSRGSDDALVCSATDSAGEHWLIVETAHESERLAWICAPATERMVELVAAGTASASDAIRHSRTGWVEMVSFVGGHTVPDRRITCAELAAGSCGIGGGTLRAALYA